MKTGKEITVSHVAIVVARLPFQGRHSPTMNPNESQTAAITMKKAHTTTIMSFE
jgi:hypothetical protein